MIRAARQVAQVAAVVALGAGQSDPVRLALALALGVAWFAARIPAAVSLALAVGAALLVWQAPRADVGIAVGLGWLLAHRALAGPGFERGGLMVSALMVVAGVADAAQPVAWIAAFVWAGVLPLALVSGRARPRRGWLAWPALAVGMTAGGYLALPRFRDVPVVEDAPPMTGFSPEVELGRAEGPVDQHEVMLRVRPAAPGPVYLRGMVLDHFDGRKWYTEVDPRPAEAPGRGGTRFEVIATRPESAAFTAGDPRAIAGAAALLQTTAGTWMFQDPLWGWAFEADLPFSTRVRTAGPPPRDVERVLPDGLDARVWAMGRGLGTEREAVEEGIRQLSRWRYSREAARVTADPLVTFLFDRRAGHCEHFASALAVLFRAAGLPSRVITGYASAEIDGDAWVVRRRHAHAWVEVWVDGAWESVDATPGPLAPPAPPRALHRAVDRWSDWDRAGWWALARVVAPGVAALVGAVGVLGLAVRGWVRRARPPSDPVERAWWRARRDLIRNGLVIPASLPPVATAEWVSQRSGGGPEGAALLALAWLLYQRRWGRVDLADAAREAEVLRARAEPIGPPAAERTRSSSRRSDA